MYVLLKYYILQAIRIFKFFYVTYVTSSWVRSKCEHECRLWNI